MPPRPSDLPPQQPDEPSAGALRQRLRKRLAALSLVGAVMVVLPLAQVLRYQNQELSVLAAERASLDPLARAVELQRDLIAHRDLAALVLGGRLALEPARRQRQGEVDLHADALRAALAAGAWERATVEAEALRADWGLLSGQVAARTIGAAQSDHGHRLLVEQVLQVGDLLADAGPVHAGAGTALALAHAVPRLSWQLALLHGPLVPAQRAQALARAEAELALMQAQLNATSRQRMPTPLARAGASATASAGHHLQLLRNAPAGTVELDAAARTARRAQLDLFAKAHEQATLQIEHEIGTASLRRGALIAALAVLALAAGALLRGLWRSAGTGSDLPPVPRAPARRGEVAQQLLQRLTLQPAAPALPRAEPRPTHPGHT